jgi:hypothetical protein
VKAELILGIVSEVAKGWNEARRMKFMKKHSKILSAMEKEKDAHFPNYNSARRARSEKTYEVFMIAFHAEVKAHNLEVAGA